MHSALCILHFKKGKGERKSSLLIFSMDKNTLINRFAENDEEKIKFAHIVDLAERCEKRNIVTSTAFLTESERTRVDMLLRGLGFVDFAFWGGFEDAERTCAVFMPDYIEEADNESANITFVVAAVDKFNRVEADFSHRDILGSLMGLGLERESIGDITAKGGEGYFAVKKSVLPFILESLEKIGRYPVSVSECPDMIFEKKEDFEEKSDTVASLRLDSVVASVFSLSRSAASDKISAGLVQVGGAVVKKTDSEVKEGDKISLKGQGKVHFTKIDGLSRKGRIRIAFRKYK